MVWRPLDGRDLGIEEGLYEGVPSHLTAVLWDWLRSYIVSGGNFQATTIRRVALMARISIRVGGSSIDVYHDLQEACVSDGHRFLNAVDAILTDAIPTIAGQRKPAANVDTLRQYLSLANSTWTVSPDNSCLTRRVEPAAEVAAAEAMRPTDVASEELAEAWRKTYSREPDASDAWDHSIKAVEHIYKPIVSPKNVKATLGTIIRDIENSTHLFQFVLKKPDGTELDQFLSTLKMLWPNPDRHGSGQTAPVSLVEAQAAVHLAVTVVQWGRTNSLTKIIS